MTLDKKNIFFLNEIKIWEKIKFYTYGGTVTGTIPFAFGGGLFNAANLAWMSQYNLLFKL